MTVIRFSRAGTKKRPVFRLVVQTKTSPRNGRFIEHLGNFFPQGKDHNLVLDKPRLQYWLGVGAQPSTSVRTHLRSVFAEFKAGSSAAASTKPAAQSEAPPVSFAANAKPTSPKGKTPAKRK